MKLGVARALVDGGWVDGDVEVADGRIVRVGAAPAGTGMAVPGYVDLQVNGFGGVDLLAADLDGYATAGAALAATGVVAYQPTLITAPAGRIVAALGVLREARERARPGPEIIGAHVEGPFLSPERPGTHPVEHLREPDLDLLERFLAAGPVTQVTLAPELPGAARLIARLVGDGVLVSAGHSDADAEAARLAFDTGVRTVTHLFNAMRRFTPRRPALPGVALARPDVTVQLIADGVHLSPETVAFVCRAAAGRFVAVTDAMAAAGAAEGEWRLGDVEITVNGLEARRSDGVLAGSVLTMDAAVRNLVDVGIPLEEALAAAASRPARLIGRPDLGVLRSGAVANVVVLDEELGVRHTIAGGQWSTG